MSRRNDLLALRALTLGLGLLAATIVVGGVVFIAGWTVPEPLEATLRIGGAAVLVGLWRIGQGDRFGARLAVPVTVYVATLLLAQPFGPNATPPWITLSVTAAAACGWVVGVWALGRNDPSIRWRDIGWRRDVGFLADAPHQPHLEDEVHPAVVGGFEDVQEGRSGRAVACSVAFATAAGTRILGPEPFAAPRWLLARRRDDAAAATISHLVEAAAGRDLQLPRLRATIPAGGLPAAPVALTSAFVVAAEHIRPDDYSPTGMLHSLVPAPLAQLIEQRRSRCPHPPPSDADAAVLARVLSRHPHDPLRAGVAATRHEPDLLTLLADDDTDEVALAVAGNAAAPREALWTLAQSTSERVIARLRQPDVWERLPEEAQSLLVLRQGA